MSAKLVRLAVVCAAAACVFGTVLAADPPPAPKLDQNCVVNVLNRTVQVSPQGGWSMPNVPSNMGRVRARATCTQGTQTFSGQTDYFNVVPNAVTTAGDIKFEAQEPVPVSLAYSETGATTLTTIGATYQAVVKATYPDNSIRDVTASTNGTNYSSTNNAIATVSPEGLITARSSGTALITARKDEVVAIKQILVNAAGDKDGDGIPDDYEVANGLNPNDKIDAQEDLDGDGLTNLREFQLGTNPRSADTDGDGIKDGEEVVAGADGFVTNPLSADTDGDGLRDGVEVLAGSSPTDPNDRNLAGALDRITVNPSSVLLTFNTVNTEVSKQLTVTGVLIDGSTINLTSKTTGTTYQSSDLGVVSFGLTDGEIFGGTSGTATVTVRNNGKVFVVNVTVESFQPKALSSISIPGYANNVDIAGDYAFIAAGNAGLVVVDVSDRSHPAVISTLDTDGTAIDLRVFGNFVFLADGPAGFKVINIANPTSPTLVAALETAGVAQDLKIDSQYAYVADGTAGVEIFDVRDPAHPVDKGHLDGLGEVKGIDAQGNRAVAVAGTSLYVIDVTDRAAPIALGAVNIGPVKDVVMDGNYAYVAAYSSGYRVVRISDPANPTITGGDAVIAPRDVELSDGLAFFAEQLFPNVIAYMNVQNPESPVFQGTIDLEPLGDYAGTGIALDGSYAYVTEESFVVGQDFGTTGNTRLFIAQYRLISDNAGVAPTVVINKPNTADPVVEGTTLTVDVTATDDVGVKAVTFSVDGTVITTDTTRPFQVPVTLPYGKTSLTISATAIDFGGNNGSASVTVPVLRDTDHDGVADVTETNVYHSDPSKPDTDGDGLTDGQEVALGTNLLSTDTDGDGRSDLAEVNAGTDPTNPDVTPPTVASSDPLPDTTGVPENRAVTVTFSEPLQAKSINLNSLKLLLGGNQVAGTVRLMPNGVDLVFTPTGLLNDFTLYDVVVSGVRDLAGNPIAATYQFKYTTGNVVDTTPPTIAASNPISGAQDVPTNAIVRIQFSEPVDPLSLNNVAMNDSQGSIGGVSTLSDDGRTLTFVPNIALAVHRSHNMTVAGVKDLFGNPTTVGISFTTAFVADSAAPQILSTSVVDGQTNVPTNATIAVRFNEAINRLALASVVLKQGATVLSTQRQFNANGGGSTVELVPNQPLTANTTYAFTIGSVEDLSGNVQAVPRTINFTTGAGQDTTAPTLVARTPLASQTNVPRNTKIEAQFSDLLNATSLHSDSVRLYNNSTGQFLTGAISMTPDGLGVRFAPTTQLDANTTYSFYVSYSVSPEDLAGHPFSTSWSFTTGSANDTTAPVVQMQSIADGATGIAVNGRLTLQFDAPVADRCVSAQTVQVTNSGGSVIPGTLSLSSDRATLTFTPSAALAVSSAYTLKLQGICDLAGNTLSNFATTFTTGASATADTVHPTVTATPAQGATNVPVNTPIVLTFSEPIDVTTLAGGISVTISGVSGEVAGNISVNGNVVTFAPLDPFPGNKSIFVSVSGVLDLAGNNNNGFSRSFTTGASSDNTPPTILSVVPNDGLIDVAPNTPIVLTFSESLDPSTVNNNTIALFVNGDIVRPSISRSTDGRTIVLNSSLPASSVASVIVTHDVRDLSGNAMADFVSAFTTSTGVDNGRPNVVTQFPGSGASNVLPDAKVVLYTSEPLNPATIQNALHISQNGVLVGGIVTVVGNGEAFSFRPNQPWAPNAYIEVFLDSTALDLKGNALNNFQGSFRVVPDLTNTAPQAQAFSPNNVSGGVPINAAVDLLFNKPLDATTLAANVFLRDYNTGVLIPATPSLYGGGQVLRVKPTGTLAVSRTYYVQLLGGLKDTSGKTLQFNNNYFFSTNAVNLADTLPPHLLSISPPTGYSDVGINAHVHARFDESVNPFTLTLTPQQTTYESVLWSDNNTEVSFVRHEPYAANTQVTESVAGAQDLAGNTIVTPNSTTFTTSALADTDAPKITDLTPFASANNVAVNAVIRVNFNEPLDPVSIDDSTVFLYDTLLGIHVPGTVTLEPNGRSLTIVPNTALLVGRSYYIYTYGVNDLSGNVMYATNIFTTSFTPDTTAPTVAATSVFNGQTNVPTNTWLQIRFSEPVSSLKLTGVKLQQNGLDVPTTAELSGDHMLLRLALVQPLVANATYSIVIGGIEDLSANALAATQTVTFTTGSGVDLIAPTVVTRTPVPSATGVPRNTQIEVQYNERINPISLTTDVVRLYDNTTGQFLDGSRTLSPDGTALRFVPGQQLAPNRTYSFYASYSGSVTDLAGNAIGASWSFTTGAAADTTAPQITLQSIADGASGVAVNGRITLQFDSQIADRCVNGQTVQLSRSGVTVAGTLTLSSDRTQITFTPQAALATSSAYKLTLQGLCDLAGNAVTNFSTTFTTSASATPDTTRPSVTITPAQSATNVSVTTPIVITFNEPIDVTTLASGTQITVSGLSGEVASNLSVNGNVVTLTPVAPLPGNSTIFVTVSNVLDLAGNTVNAVTRTFTTGAAGDTTAPHVISVSPSDGTVDVASGTPIVITFSESLNASTVNNNTFALFVNGAIIRPSISRSTDNRAIILTAGLPTSSVVSVVATDDVTDLSGNHLSDFVSAFTTAVGTDTTRPSVITMFPGSGTINVRPTADIFLSTREALDVASLQQAVHVSQNGAVVNGTIGTTGGGQYVTFHPNQPWANGALIQIFVDDSARDVSGNAFQTFSGSFTVLPDPAAAAPTIVAFSPNAAVSSVVPINVAIDTQFSERLDASTVTSANVILRDYNTGVAVASTVSLIKQGYIARVLPQAPLQPSHTYYVAVGTGVHDLSGTALAFAQNLFFSTNAVAVSDTQPPKVLAVSPPNGSTGIGVNARTHWRFDEPMSPLSLFIDPTQLAASYNWGSSSTDLEIVYHDPRASNTQQTDSVSAAQDFSGNAVTGPSSTTYTTGSGPDLTVPPIPDATPFSNATNVGLSPVVRARFNELMDPVSVNTTTVFLYDNSTGAHVSNAPVLESDGRTMTIVPTQALQANHSYTYYTYGVEDIAGNQHYSTRAFTTGAALDTQAPLLILSSVQDAQSGVPTNANLQVRFNEPINSLKLSGVVLRVGGQPVPASLQLTGDFQTITFKTVQPLTANTSYVLSVSDVEDLSGNVMPTPRTISFTTGAGTDLVAPVLVLRTPLQNATAVPRNIQPEAQWNERLNPISFLTVADAVRLYNNSTGQFVPGTVSLNPDGITIHFAPAAILDANRTYTYYVVYTSGSIEDVADNATNTSWSFTTGAN